MEAHTQKVKALSSPPTGLITMHITNSVFIWSGCLEVSRWPSTSRIWIWNTTVAVNLIMWRYFVFLCILVWEWRKWERQTVCGRQELLIVNDTLTDKCISCLRCVMAQGKQPHFLESTVVAHYLPLSCHRLMPFGFASNLTALSAMLASGVYMKSVRLVLIPLRL